MARIELQEIAHSYMNRPQNEADFALKRIHNTWRDGGAYALLGPSGCGKTTLLNIISGLLIPSQGKVVFDGKDVTALPPEQRNIAQVFQFPVLYDTMTVAENLAFPLKNRGADPKEIRERVAEVADMLDLTPFLKKKAAGLGADAKQKISLGRGLVRRDVAAILFDEPLTVIDPQLKWHLRRKLKAVHEQLGLTLIYVTHDQTEALTFADQVLVMKDGRLLQTGTPQELFENPRHKFVGYFIGSPGMNFLPCRVDGATVHLGGGTIPLPEELAALAAGVGSAGDGSGGSSGGYMELGIRPAYLKLRSAADDPENAGLPVDIMTVEDQGSFRMATVRLGQDTVRVRVGEEHPIPTENVRLLFPAERLKLYSDECLLDPSDPAGGSCTPEPSESPVPEAAASEMTAPGTGAFETGLAGEEKTNE